MLQKKISLNGELILIIVTAFLLIITGITRIANYNDSWQEFGRAVQRMFGEKNDIIGILFSVIDLLIGITLIIALIISLKGKVWYIVHLSFFIIWGIKIVIFFFFRDPLQPDVLFWLSGLMPELLIWSVLWISFRRHSKE